MFQNNLVGYIRVSLLYLTIAWTISHHFATILADKLHIFLTVMKKQKNLKTRVGIFKNMGGNIPGGNFLGGNFPGRNSPRGGGLMRGSFPGGSFPDTS